MEDKAVSTEDLWAVSRKTNVASSLARLEAILQTLLENKARALRDDRHRGKHRTREIPRSILKRFRLTDRPSSVKIGVVNEKLAEQPQQTGPVETTARKSALKKDFSTSSAGSHYRFGQSSFEASSTISDEDRYQSFQCDNIDCCTVNDRPPTGCCCSQDIEGQLLHSDADYASARRDDNDMEAAARRKRRRRRRRKRRAKRRCELARVGGGAYLIEAASGDVAVAVEDSTKKAKWTIVATACVLLFMCLLLSEPAMRTNNNPDSQLLSAVHPRRSSRSGSFSHHYNHPLRRAASLDGLLRELDEAARWRRRSCGRRRRSEGSSRRSSASREHRRRRSSGGNSSREAAAAPEVEVEAGRRRRAIVMSVLGAFFVLSLISVSAVLVTLTHRSTVALQRDNSTVNVTYYTFAANPDLCEHTEW
ncbi:unnamed protein product [Phyllotreta striolata]|uniref:Uncharacterized protein n=1 Tax=Phyllotreta striolata TaxID=444603 RepID=A0A9N9XQ29_PHYSR|nr:unnamed protein product [Phyllotreta striolata]